MHDDEIGFDELYDAETLAALEGGEAPASDDDPGPLPSRLIRWSRSTATGMVLSGIAFGLREVLDPREQNQIVIEVDDEGESPHLPIELFLDPDSPQGSLCVVRRHLLPPPVA